MNRSTVLSPVLKRLGGAGLLSLLGAGMALSLGLGGDSALWANPPERHLGATPAVKSATPAKPDAKPAASQPAGPVAPAPGYRMIDSLVLLKDPAQYLNQKVAFEGVFNRFADTGLDYKKAFRDSRDYVSFFILRPDVTGHAIPMAELKLFYPRKKSDAVSDLETGDRILVQGTEFSTALDEPWIDVDTIKIVKKTDKPERKHGSEF